MIKILKSLPKDVTIAFSGGVDSVAIADFLSKSHNITCAHFNHGTSECDRAEDFVRQYCEQRGWNFIVGKIMRDRRDDESLEEYWRNERYDFLNMFSGTVVTGHNLDDCVETYLFSSLNGTAKVIPYQRRNVVRPFLTTTKETFVNWCIKRNLPWYEDSSNQDTKHMRNYIRKELMPHALHVNPGLFKVVRKIVQKRIDSIVEV